MGKHRKPAIPDALRPYEQGYRKPPAKSQFKVGNSANPKGRPTKKSKTVGQQLQDILESKVEVSVRGRIRTLTQQQVILETITMKAMKGDVRALECLLRLQKAYHDDPAHVIDRDMLDDADRAILDRHLEELARARKSRAGSDVDDPQEDE